MTPSTAMRLARSVETHPDWCASEHARAMGITRERVRQIRIALALPMPVKRWAGGRRLPVLACAVCGQPTHGRVKRHAACMPLVTPERRREQCRAAGLKYARKMAAERKARALLASMPEEGR